jgi:transformation/transcription domain-associated protein
VHRLQDMLGHLSSLMRPLVAALRSGDDLVTHALRILEHWVDSLNPEFLEPPMATVAPQLMLALWALLKPTSGAVGHKARPHHPAEIWSVSTQGNFHVHL